MGSWDREGVLLSAAGGVVEWVGGICGCAIKPPPPLFFQTAGDRTLHTCDKWGGGGLETRKWLLPSRVPSVALQFLFCLLPFRNFLSHLSVG